MKHFLEPDSSSCICVAHQKEAKLSHPPNHIPKWITSVAPVEKKQCIYPSCQEDSKLIAPSFASITDIEAFLDVKSSDDHPLLLALSYATSNKNFILKYFRCRDGKRTETRIGMEGICITHSCIPLYTVYMQHIMAHCGGMQEWVIQIPSIPILVSVLFPSLHLRIKFLLLFCIVFMRMCTKPHPHPVIS